VTEWDDHLRWIGDNHNNLRPSPADRPGTIRIDMPPRSGFPNDEGLERDLARLLCDDTIAAKLRKLGDHHGVSERHLALGVMDFYAAGSDLLEHLLMGRERQIPKYQPAQDFPATHVWISGGSHAVLSWNRGDGWQWRTLPRPEQTQNAQARARR